MNPIPGNCCAPEWRVLASAKSCSVGYMQVSDYMLVAPSQCRCIHGLLGHARCFAASYNPDAICFGVQLFGCCTQL